MEQSNHKRHKNKFAEPRTGVPQSGVLVQDKRGGWWLWIIAALVLGVCVPYGIHHRQYKNTSIPVSRYKHIPTLNELLTMSTDELARQDLAIVNLACAEGLYGAENLDVRACLQQIDEWTASLAGLLKEREFMFYRLADKMDNSINRWRCGAIVQYLNQMVGLSYNPALRDRKTGGVYETSYFRDSRDFLIHGLILEKNRGTCASMPVLFACIARRLGYPIKLVTTRNHLFARWDDPISGERFNIEVTDKSAEFRPDEFYRSGMVKLNPGEVERMGYLVSLSPDREFSSFLHLRAMCLWDMGKLEEAKATMEASARFDMKHRKLDVENHYILEIERQLRVLKMGGTIDQSKRAT
jgi:hypothetical protein